MSKRKIIYGWISRFRHFGHLYSFFTIEKGRRTYAILIKNHTESENNISFAQNAIVTEMGKILQEIFESVFAT